MFVHLHVHTEYSMLDGASRINDIVKSAKSDGQPALGITDHGNMYGLIEFYKACRTAEIKPILGIEAYMAHDNIAERPKRRGKLDDSGGETESGRKLFYHLTLLAKNNTGYKNLIQLSSRSFLEGYYYKPRVDWDILSDHSEGLIATTGCLGSQVNQALLNNNFEEAKARAVRLQEIFGRENLFVELQDHGIDEQKTTQPQLLEIAKKLNAPLLATNDCHYTEKGDARSHDALLCVQTGSEMSQEDRFKFEGEQHYLKASEEMRKLFKDLPEACDETLAVGEMCNVEIEFGEPKLPHYPIEDPNQSEDEYFKSLVFEGAKKRWGKNLKDSTIERLEYEMQIISDMGFSSYFLIIWDLVKYARTHDIRVGPGRGSAAGCAVAYCLGITEVDPIKHNLLFERFLNPARRQMPDIDLDFDSRYRDDLIRYLSQKYGRDNVAQIITFSKIKARAAVRDAARVLGHSYQLGDKLVKAMPPLVMGRSTPLSACLTKDPKYKDSYAKAGELRQMYENDSDAKEVVDVAIGLEDLCRQDSVHAAAVVLTREPLTEYLPIQRKPDGSNRESAPIVTQYEMNAVEELGLLKMDLLGLRNLDVITDALEIIELTTGEKITIEEISLEDAKTYELLQNAETMGVFQLESDTMRTLMAALAPESLDDVAALVALHRPGPMEANMHMDFADRKNKRKGVKYIHSDAAEILSETHGLMIYQESMMLIAQKFAGFNAAEADDLRKACGKKIRSIMAEQKEKFIEGCEKTIDDSSGQPYGKKVGEAWWAQIEPFADYAFNKSHSYAYGLVAYQTAYLKANYPVQFMAALLTSVKDKTDKSGVYLAECRRMGINVAVPDINISIDKHTVGESSEIIFGLHAITNVGIKMVELILEERDKNGAFVDFFDFSERLDSAVLNKKTIEALIKAGSFDSMGYTRMGLMQQFENILEIALEKRKENEMGAVSMFEDAGMEKPIRETVEIPDVEFTKSLKLEFEKEMLGRYVSDHPLAEFGEQIAECSDCSLLELEKMEDGAAQKVCGVIVMLSPRQTKKGQSMANLVIEDLDHRLPALVFPQKWAHLKNLLEEDRIMVISARLRKEDEQISIIVEDAIPIESAERLGPPEPGSANKNKDHADKGSNGFEGGDFKNGAGKSAAGSIQLSDLASQLSDFSNLLSR